MANYPSMPFRDLKEGDTFGLNGRCYSTCIKINKTEYVEKRSGDVKHIFGGSFRVWVKELPSKEKTVQECDATAAQS